MRLASNDRPGIIEIFREVYIEDECPENEQELFVQFAERELDQAFDRLKLEQGTWPDQTDCDRLDEVEAALREQGILLWQVSPCCDTCTGAELPDRINHVVQLDPGFRKRVRGYAFFIEQNMPEMLADGTDISVYLAYGWLSPDDSETTPEMYETNALGIAREVCQCLVQLDLEPNWDGDFSRKIGLSLSWQRRAIPTETYLSPLSSVRASPTARPWWKFW